jgi:hypothetical protein
MSHGIPFTSGLAMSITSISSSIATSPVSNLQPPSAAINGADPDGAGASPGAGRTHHGHGGGHMRSAVTDALQSLGFTLPSSATSPASATPSSADSTAGTGSSDASKVKSDLRQFMHQLFEAVKGESATAASSSAGGSSASGDPQSGFASGLAALIGQVGNGTAPAALQSAFAQLSSDLSPSSAAAPSSTSGSAASQAPLQAFLTKLQQELGYGQSGASASGALLATQV